MSLPAPSGTQRFSLTCTNKWSSSQYKRPPNFILLPHQTLVTLHNYYSWYSKCNSATSSSPLPLSPWSRSLLLLRPPPLPLRSLCPKRPTWLRHPTLLKLVLIGAPVTVRATTGGPAAEGMHNLNNIGGRCPQLLIDFLSRLQHVQLRKHSETRPPL